MRLPGWGRDPLMNITRWLGVTVASGKPVAGMEVSVQCLRFSRCRCDVRLRGVGLRRTAATTMSQLRSHRPQPGPREEGREAGGGGGKEARQKVKRGGQRPRRGMEYPSIKEAAQKRALPMSRVPVWHPAPGGGAPRRSPTQPADDVLYAGLITRRVSRPASRV